MLRCSAVQWLVSGRTKTLVWELWLAAETVLGWAAWGCTRTLLVVSSERENWLLWETFTLGTRTVIQFCFKKLPLKQIFLKVHIPPRFYANLNISWFHWNWVMVNFSSWPSIFPPKISSFFNEKKYFKSNISHCFCWEKMSEASIFLNNPEK